MKYRILLFLIGVLLVGCRTSNSCDAYFSPVPVDKIKEISSQDLKYEKMDVDYHFPELGYYEIPLTVCNIKYDTKSHFTVIVSGYAVFRDTDITNHFQIVDSVSLSEIVVKKEQQKLELYSNKQNNDFNYRPWKECPLPKSVRERIREDFLIRMKYMKFHLKTDQRIFYFTCPYRLW